MAFPLATFRTLYPAFVAISDDAVLAASVQAECLADVNGCACSEQAWLALTAHVLSVNQGASSGGAAPGAIASVSVGGVSVSFQQAAGGDSWSVWLGSTPYGQMARALLTACSGSGFYVGGAPEGDAFAGVYGYRGR